MISADCGTPFESQMYMSPFCVLGRHILLSITLSTVHGRAFLPSGRRFVRSNLTVLTGYKLPWCLSTCCGYPWNHKVARWLPSLLRAENCHSPGDQAAGSRMGLHGGNPTPNSQSDIWAVCWYIFTMYNLINLTHLQSCWFYVWEQLLKITRKRRTP